MKNSYQLFLAFFIPFSAAVMLVTLGFHIFDWTPIRVIGNHRGEGISFSEGYGKPFGVEDLYKLIIFILFGLSAVMPLFVKSRNEPIEIKLNINGN